jgi:aminoglycoside 2'-N-acetyltransferase I
VTHRADLQVTVLRDAELSAASAKACAALVLESFGSRFTDDDWQHAAGGWRVIATEGEAFVGHAAVVPRRLRIGDRDLAAGYVEAVATRVGRHGQGIGTALMKSVNDVIAAHFDLGALSTSRHSFYAGLGWERWRGPAYVRDGEQLIRTADEDAGLMVLRVNDSAGIDLSASITCDARSGDDW